MAFHSIRPLLIGLVFSCSFILRNAHPSTLEILEPFMVVYKGDIPAAGYMTIRQTGSEADRLLSARLADVTCGSHIELHDHISQFLGGQEIKKMVPLKYVDIPVTSPPTPPIYFSPGGKHLMLYNLPPSLKQMPTIQVILSFEKAGEIKVNFAVRTGLPETNVKKKACACDK